MTTTTAARPPERCSKCGHAREMHPQDGLCRVQGCPCFFYQNYEAEHEAKGGKEERRA